MYSKGHDSSIRISVVTLVSKKLHKSIYHNTQKYIKGIRMCYWRDRSRMVPLPPGSLRLKINNPSSASSLAVNSRHKFNFVTNTTHKYSQNHDQTINLNYTRVSVKRGNKERGLLTSIPLGFTNVQGMIIKNGHPFRL